MRGYLGFALVIVATVSSAANKKQPVAAHGQVQLVRGPQNHLLMPATVNGHAATFLVDTGSAVSFLQRDRVTQFGMRLLGTETQTAGRSFPLAAIEQLSAGQLSLGTMEVALYDPAQFRGPVPGKGGKAADGIIGLDLLRHYRAVINCRTQQLFFQTGPVHRLNITETTRALGFTRIPIAENSRNVLTVPCSIDGNSGALVLDTGAFVTVLNSAAAHCLELKEDPSRLNARTTGGRVRHLELARVKDFRIGGVPIASQRFAVMELFPPKKPLRTVTGINRIEYYEARTPRPDVVGLLGNELLYQHSAIIDLDSMSLFLK